MKHTGKILRLIVLLALVAGCQEQAAKEQASGVGGLNPTNFSWVRIQRELDVDGLHVMNVPTVVGTATPALRIESSGVGNPLEIRKASTPVFAVDVDGNAALGSVTGSGVQQFNNVVQIAPTPATTATPGLYINNTSVGASSLAIADAATVVAEFYNNGNYL